MMEDRFERTSNDNERCRIKDNAVVENECSNMITSHGMIIGVKWLSAKVQILQHSVKMERCLMRGEGDMIHETVEIMEGSQDFGITYMTDIMSE